MSGEYDDSGAALAAALRQRESAVAYFGTDADERDLDYADEDEPSQ